MSRVWGVLFYSNRSTTMPVPNGEMDATPKTEDQTMNLARGGPDHALEERLVHFAWFQVFGSGGAVGKRCLDGVRGFIWPGSTHPRLTETFSDPGIFGLIWARYRKSTRRPSAWTAHGISRPSQGPRGRILLDCSRACLCVTQSAWLLAPRSAARGRRGQRFR